MDKSLVKNNISESLNVKIYPNPITDDIIHVKQFTDEKYTHFEISNLMGQVFASGKLSNQPIHVNHLASGSYLIALRNSHSKIVKRLIK